MKNFDEVIEKYYNFLSETEIPKNPTPEDMTNYQCRVDKIRTDIFFEYGRVQGLLLKYEHILKVKKEIMFNVVRDEILAEDPKAKPTVDVIKSASTAVLANIPYKEKQTIIDIVEELIYQESSLKALVDIVKEKQDSVHTPNKQIQYEYTVK